ncbi:MAG: amino acid adenylation domain-containing protein [Acidobacteria bacterium]|nr:amino acid adenylation domain-containing protein [Acidobacteriota bacterium]
MSPLADRLAGLTPAQRALVERKLRARPLARAVDDPIAPRPNPAVHDLSFAQQRLWFVEQLQPSGAAYHMSFAVRIDGPLDAGALEWSLGQIVARHEVLRAGYVDEGGRPAQRVQPPGGFHMPVHDVSARAAQARESDARAIANAEMARPFDLSAPPMLRAALVRLAASDHVLLLVLHHIAADGWSMGVLARELSALYEARTTGGRDPLPPPGIQYADYAAWQRGDLESRLPQQLAWWRAALDRLPVLDLPTDRPRPAVQSADGAREPFLLPAELVARLAHLGRRHDATLFMTLLTAFQALLARWSGQSDVAVGIPVAGRGRRELEELIGLFVNTLVIRTPVPAHASWRDLLAQVRSGVTSALAHQDVPFDTLVDDLGVERTLSRAPLTSVFFAFQNVPDAALRLAGLRTSEFELDRRTARFDLSLFALETGGGVRGAMEYRTDLFDQATIRRMLDAYTRLLEALASDPDARIARTALLAGDDRRRALVEWNATAQAYSRAPLVPDLVARHASAAPAALAIADGDRRLTYRDLDRRSNRLARCLAARGAGVESIVALYCDRGSSFVVSALAAMKAGAAYAPIDPRTPGHRVERMLRKAGIGTLIVERAGDVPVPGWNGAIVALDAARAEIDAQPDAPFACPAGADNLAYLVHTSGSTGEPNGVAVTHGSLLNLVAWHQRTYKVAPGDAGAQVASVGFDACVWELWPCLAAGASIHVPDRETRDAPAALWTWIARRGIGVTFLPTPMAEAALRERLPAGLKLRALLTGGDRLHDVGGDLPFAFVNHYGPTESCVVTSCAPVEAGGAPSIGRPIDNTRVYVLDDDVEPVPIGVRGELYVGGDGLARGYAGAPALTAERFVPDHLSGAPGARLYRTGDIVRFRTGGALEFVGRRDRQVKIRGHRIELGDVESALASDARVRAAAAAVHGDDRRGPVLVGYVVPAEGAVLADAELRAIVKARLPEYMIPARFVAMEALPLTRNGKLDRAALPAPAEAAGEAAYVAPGNEVEQIIAAACAELLGVAQVGMLDNFFDLGGHSLLATQLASRLRRDLQLDVSLRSIFAAASLAELSEGILERLVEDGGS